MVSDKNIFSMFFPILAYENNVTPGQGLFWPQGYNLNKLGRGPSGDATYQGSRPYDLRQEEFSMVFPI